MNRYLIALALAAQVSNATTCQDGEWFNEESNECVTCIQFTTDEDRLDLEQGDCPPIEFVALHENFCEKYAVGYGQT